MIRKMPIPMQIRRLQEFLIRNGYDPETFDLEQHIDRSLNYRENRANIAGLLNIRAALTGRKQIEHEYCEDLGQQCEIKCDKNSCQIYRRIGCVKTHGKITGCVPERIYPIKIRAYCVSDYTRQYRDRMIHVQGYCRGETFRRCT